MDPKLTLVDRAAIEAYCSETKRASPSSIHAPPTEEFSEVSIYASRRTTWKSYVIPTRHASIDDLLRKLFQRCHTKRLTLSLDEDWISPVLGDSAYIALLDLASLEVTFAKNRKHNPMSTTTVFALVLSNSNLTHLTLHNAEKADPNPPPGYNNCTIPGLLQHSNLTHLTLRETDITELNTAKTLGQDDKRCNLKVLDIGAYSGGDKPEDHERAAGILVGTVAGTLEELSLGVYPRITALHPPFAQLCRLRLGSAFPAASAARLLRSLATNGETTIQELEICCSKEGVKQLSEALSGIKAGLFPSLQKLTYNVDESEEDPKEYSAEMGDTMCIWDKFIAVLQKAPV